MLDYWRFLRREPALLGYGVLLTLSSSIGQTFFISLFVPSILGEFGLSPAGFGALYASATLGSGLLLPIAGRGIDRISLARYTAAVLTGLALSAFLLAGAAHVALLGVALLGLRLTGQGLSPHTGMTAMARLVMGARGKALSIASLGFPLGEATLPLITAASLQVAHWRVSWVVAGGVVLAGFLPLALKALEWSRVDPGPSGTVPASPEPNGVESDSNPGRRRRTEEREQGEVQVSWPLRRVLRDARFWLLIPAALLPPFWATGLILYQAPLAELKGWSLTLMASAFLAFAAARVVFSLAVGGGVDRWSARALFPLAVLPMGLGVLALELFGGRWAAFACLGLLGATIGMSGNVKTALWAELYGTRHLGAIKSLDGGLMVLSTAAAPLVVGGVVDRPGAVSALLWGAVGSVVVGALLAARAVRRDPSPASHGSG